MKKSILFSILLFTSTLSQAQSITQQERAEKSFEKFKQFYSLVYNYYLDTVDFNKLVETAINKSLENLDPHSAYLPPREASSETDRLRGNFEGIGISYNVHRDTLQVADVIANGPSEKIGLLAGDKMIKINDTIFAGKGYKADDYVTRLKGKKGTKVKVEILRSGKLLDFTITRDVIPMYSVDASFMTDKTTGYIRLNKFSGTTPQEIDTAIKKLKSLGMETLIIDLQGNGGGMLTSAVALSDEFIEKDRLLVYTRGLHSPYMSYNSTPSGLWKEGKVIVLVNEQSASASEILAGAIQDWDRGLIVGRRTYGKGLVQRPFSLLDNSQLRLTTAQYFTPSGRCIQKPYSDDKEDYRADLLHRMQSGQLTKADTVKVPDSLMKFTGKGRKVYGGGGITPDIYVPIDTTMNSDYYFQLFRKGVLNTFATDYANKKKVELLLKFPNEDYYVSNYKITEELMNQLIEAGEKEGIKKSDSSLIKSKKLLETVLKANIGRNLYKSSAFYKIILEIDPLYQKAIAVSKENFSKYNVRNE
jgi:carboxyl-terminal processing protease